MLTNEFNQLKLPEELLVSLTDLNYHEMTPVQAESLPAILAGRDVIVQARTGSGKTAAFALGLLAKLKVQRFRIQSLVICPTRELAEQVAEEIRKLCRTMHNVKVLTLCGGVPVKAQILSLEHGAHILVGTPGRLLDHLQQQRLDFSELTTLVLDEADRMLEMGFQDQLAELVQATPTERQTLLFSATYPAGIERLAASLLRQPLRITVTDDSGQSATQQRFFDLNGVPRDEAAMRLLQHYRPTSCLVFCNTKREAQEIADSLKYNQFSVLALHGDLEQKDRDQTLIQFTNQSACVLVATDVAARGLDISGLDLVINLQPAHDTDTHIHRIGRTGRAGEAGLALTLVGPSDDYKFRLIEDRLNEKVALQPLPGAELLQNRPLQAPMITIQIQGGKKHKLRPGDIVGALTSDKQLDVNDIGKIQLQPMWSYVAIKREKIRQALDVLNNGKIKGRSFRARAI